MLIGVSKNSQCILCKTRNLRTINELNPFSLSWLFIPSSSTHSPATKKFIQTLTTSTTTTSSSSPSSLIQNVDSHRNSNDISIDSIVLEPTSSLKSKTSQYPTPIARKADLPYVSAHRYVGAMPAPSLGPIKSDMIQEHQLSVEQSKLINVMLKGNNLYFTGKAGTGKSQLVKQFVSKAKAMGRRVAVVAPTGIAAANIGGQTIHSFSGLTIYTDSSFNPLNLKRKLKKKAQENLMSTDVLVIDEVSMCRPDLFRNLDQLFREFQVGRRDVPFGGIQVILCGDFYQLPPIFADRRETKRKQLLETLHDCGMDIDEKEIEEMSSDRKRSLFQSNIKFLFDSFSWKHLLHDGMLVSELKTVYRQTDPDLIKMLDFIRHGECNDFVLDVLHRCRHKEFVDGIVPTKIFAYKDHVNKENERQLELIPGDPIVFSSKDSVIIQDTQKISNLTSLTKLRQPELYKEEFSKFNVDASLGLKRGAQVILTRNVDVEKGLVNGSRGVVVDFVEEEDALLETKVLLPIVKFIVQTSADTTSGKINKLDYQDFIINHQVFTMDIHCGDITLQRIQLPLKLGWSLTVHKSQGMTLDRMEINLPTAFSPGQAYVAFSRVRSLEGLLVKRFSAKSIFSSPRVKEFYEKLWECDRVI